MSPSSGGIRRSVVWLGVVVVELDAVLLGKGGVLVVLVLLVLGGGARLSAAIPEPESNAPGPDCFSFLASSKRR